MSMLKSSIVSLLWVFAELPRVLTNQLRNRYRPEQHYMRGPGPRFRAKHDFSQI